MTKIKKNFFYQLLYEAVCVVVPFITSPYIARVIGAKGIGIYSFSYSVAYYFVLFSLLGINNYGNRVVAKVRDDKHELNKTFSNLYSVHFLISMFFVFLYIGYLIVLKTEKIYAAIQALYVVSALFDINWFYSGIEQFRIVVLRNIFIKILTVILIFSFVKTPNDLVIYCFIVSGSIMISELIMWIPIRNYVQWVKPNYVDMKKHIKPLVLLFVPAIAVSLYKYMDKIMLGAMSDRTSLGLYENAEKMINIPQAVIFSFGVVMLPRMSNLVANKAEEKTKKYISISMQYVMILAIAMACGIAGLGKVFAPVFWGDSFFQSGFLIIGLAITMPFMSFANIIRTQYLIPNERDREYLVSVSAGAIVNLIVNSILIPKYGAMGTMAGTIAAEILVCIIQTCYVKKVLEIREYILRIIPFMICGIIMFSLVFLIGERLGKHISTLLIQIVTGIFVYGLFTIVYLYRSKDPVFINGVSKMNSYLKK